ncbi:hypothetical protein CH63R_09896 [Colletotrichum higginsianum IMI 349063]|uniref:Uncharacterized protein n=1 Tax=Colletotrichum higginsianum (strain IMI 349063) TaxID=759273 RepID=A0A1B7Y186_COLHI|nr:uncharacterized protein CH63R_09896 [Colletotrichum higginsianum IMI 349063]OBR05776.1 hypothetical protein CH63R_09896 [Colletotrichum higginsianum IMI 349063]
MVQLPTTLGHASVVRSQCFGEKTKTDYNLCLPCCSTQQLGLQQPTRCLDDVYPVFPFDFAKKSTVQ